jgi:hypothetical protein
VAEVKTHKMRLKCVLCSALRELIYEDGESFVQSALCKPCWEKTHARIDK